GVDRIDIDQKYYNALVEAKGGSSTACKQIATLRLGSANNKLASFSFDGADAGKIVLSKDYDSFTDLMWKYSLDGGVTKSQGTLSHAFQLSKEELAKINDVDDIKIYIVGLNEANPTYTIDIVKGSISSTLYGNDLENRVVGVELTYEWRYNETDEWTCYRDASPDCTGNKTLYVRNGGTGNTLPSETHVVFTFTEDNQPDTRKYVPVSNLSIFGVSSEAASNGWPATNAIDANLYTRWVTDWKGTDENRYIILKLDRPIYLSALEYVPTQPTVTGTSGTIKSLIVSVSTNAEAEDEETVWTKIYSADNWEANRDTKVIDLSEPVLAQYIKIETPVCYNAQFTATNNYTSAVMFNLFQDVTKNPYPTAGIAYSTKETTNGYVVARLVNPSTHITITNNNGNDTYVFTENGEFTFEFVDERGNKGT
ncbi:MAG: discoidin domain-containing protein, partial [Bacilli bacterium]|nr:discoidin domain-containing protein [Bacilli bacterium]